MQETTRALTDALTGAAAKQQQDDRFLRHGMDVCISRRQPQAGVKDWQEHGYPRRNCARCHDNCAGSGCVGVRNFPRHEGDRFFSSPM